MSENKEHFPITRQCGHCREEFGIKTPDASVGYCKRHTRETLAEAFALIPKWTKAKDDEMWKILDTKPEEMYPPDMSAGFDG